MNFPLPHLKIDLDRDSYPGMHHNKLDSINLGELSTVMQN